MLRRVRLFIGFYLLIFHEHKIWNAIDKPWYDLRLLPNEVSVSGDQDKQNSSFQRLKGMLHPKSIKLQLSRGDHEFFFFQ